MKTNQKSYHVIKLKAFLKGSPLVLIYQAPKMKNENWVLLKQKLTKLQIKQYQVSKSTATKAFRSSIYKNFDRLTCSNITILALDNHRESIQLRTLTDKLDAPLDCLALKLNRQIYTTRMIENIRVASYESSTLDFVSVLRKYLKAPYTWKSK